VASEQVFGEVSGYPEGTTFPDRRALAAAGVHRALQGAITGGVKGAESIVIAGRYDDADFGDQIVFTGQGGRDALGKQIADQRLTIGNLALARSHDAELPVRVIRGAKADSAFAPASGYRYDGLYRVVDYQQATSTGGFGIWQFRLVKESEIHTMSAPPKAMHEEHAQWASDAPTLRDTLRRDALASILAARLRRFTETEPDDSFLLHVDGPWGSGKSTLLKLLATRLERHYLVVPFDSWRNAKVDPPWWSLLVTLRGSVSRSLPWWRRPVFRIADAWTRARHGSTPYLSAGLVLLALVAGFLLLNPVIAPGGITQAVKNIGALASTAGSVVLGVLVLSRFVWWDSARGARRLEQVHTNPMEEVTCHFSWLLTRAPRRVVFLIDDLDRCQEKYVVELLDAIQTLVRDAPRRTESAGAAHFVVAAHGNWLRQSYEIIHKGFTTSIEEPGRGLGHMFLDKLFQLSAPMPALSAEAKQRFLDRILGIPDSAQSLTQEDHEILMEIEQSASEQDLMKILRTATARQREISASRVVERMSEPELFEISEHALQKFAPLLDGNPRSMKRFINTYSVLRATRILEGIDIDSDVLAFWIVLSLRWPKLTDHLEKQVVSTGTEATGQITVRDLPPECEALRDDPELRRVLASAPVQLTSERIRACCGAGS
jgi:hypothetical protein